MTIEICLTAEDARDFAQAARDNAPLHLDSDFASQTPYGRCISHGALAVIAALASLAPDEQSRLSSITARFRRPLFLSSPYTAVAARVDSSRREITVQGGGLQVLELKAELASASRPDLDAWRGAEDPVARAVVEPAVGLEIGSGYSADRRRLRELATRHGAGSVPGRLLESLGLCSWIVGVRLGPRALLVAVAVGVDEEGDASVPRVVSVDDRIGAVRVAGTSAAACRIEVNAFMLRPVPPVTPSLIRLRSGTSRALLGEEVIVVGGTRGIGAAVAGGLAMHGAQVVALGRRPPPLARRDDFSPGRVEYLACDAADPAAAAAAIERLSNPAGAVFCAAPPLNELGVHPGAVAEFKRYSGESLGLVLTPLAALLENRHPPKWLVFFSSPAAEHPPRAWLHYAVAKRGIEAVATYCREHAAAEVLVARPPKTWTDFINGPGAWLDASSTVDVAADVIRWVLERRS